MKNNQLIQKFYTAFSEGNVKEMLACYHEDVTFQDPVFGKLKGKRAFKMWEMLLSKKEGSTKISFDNIKTTTENGTANWVAEYFYGEKKRKVINKVSATFEFKEDKVITHSDSFDLWLWTRQAMGILGFLIGWTPYMKNKIQQTTNKRLDEFMKK